MNRTASKLDWLKTRKDFNTNPVARIATRLLEHRYAPAGDSLYPWILREIKRGNVQLPKPYQEGEGWRKLVEQEMAVEHELARRNAIIDAPDFDHATHYNPNWNRLRSEEDPAAHNIDFSDLQNEGWNDLTDWHDSLNRPRAAFNDAWHVMNQMDSPPMNFALQHPETGESHELTYNDLKDWERVLQDRSKRRKGIDPMQFDAHKFKSFMDGQWQPEYLANSVPDDGEVVHRYPDGWTMRRLQDAEQADREGELMGHCAGQYGRAIEDGATHLFSLRDQNNLPHTTVEIAPTPHGRTDLPGWAGGFLRQVYGKEDSQPIPAYQQRVRNWFAAMPPEHQPFLDSHGLGHDYYPDPNPAVPQEANTYESRARRHHHGIAHKNRVTGRICHCPWGGGATWSWDEDNDGDHASDGVQSDGDDSGGSAGISASSSRGVASGWDLPAADGWGPDPGEPAGHPHLARDVHGSALADDQRRGSRRTANDEDWEFDQGEAGTDQEYEDALLDQHFGGGFQSVVNEFAQTGLTCGFTEDAQSVNISHVDVPEEDRGQGTGSQFMQAAREYCREQHKQLIVSRVDNPGFFDKFPFLQRNDAPGDKPVYQTVSHIPGVCPTCGDPLQGQYGTFCPRCQWSEHDVLLDTPADQNPPDPTRDLHKGIQARTAGETFPQEQRRWEQLPQDESADLYTEPSGWSIKKHWGRNIDSVGRFMRNCWQGTDPQDVYPSHFRHWCAVHDPEGMPRAAFHMVAPSGRRKWSADELLGMRNKPVAYTLDSEGSEESLPVYRMMDLLNGREDWVNQVGGQIVNHPQTTDWDAYDNHETQYAPLPPPDLTGNEPWMQEDGFGGYRQAHKIAMPWTDDSEDAQWYSEPSPAPQGDPQYMYHVGPWTARDSIQQTGLSADKSMHSGYPRGQMEEEMEYEFGPNWNEQDLTDEMRYRNKVWLHPTLEMAQKMNGYEDGGWGGNQDIWRVNVAGLPLKQEGDDWGGYSTHHNIRPDRLELLHAGGRSPRQSSEPRTLPEARWSAKWFSEAA